MEQLLQYFTIYSEANYIYQSTLWSLLTPSLSLSLYITRHSPLPIASQLLDFSDDIELFPRDLLQSSASASAMTMVNGTSFASADFYPFLPSMDSTNFSSLLDIQLPSYPAPDDLLDAIANDYGYANAGYPSVGPPPVLYDECLAVAGGLTNYVGTDTIVPSTSSSSCLFMDSGIDISGYEGGVQGQWFFSGGDMMAGPVADTGMALQEMAEYPNGTVTANYQMESMQHGSGKLQVLGDGQQQQQQQQQQPPASDRSNLEDSTFKVGRLSAEERKEKIHRYMKKRNRRNFSKKIKYACRKTLADSRPRVRGRFAKNEEFGASSSNNEYDDDEVLAKEEDIFDDSDILAHITGVNSFSYKYTVESWM